MAQTIFRDIVQDVLKSLVTCYHDSGIKRQSLSQRNSVRAIERGLVLTEIFLKVQITKESISGRLPSPWPRLMASSDNLRTLSKDLFHSLQGENGRNIYHICSSSSQVATSGMLRIVLTKPLARPGHNRQKKNVIFRPDCYPSALEEYQAKLAPVVHQEEQ